MNSQTERWSDYEGDLEREPKASLRSSDGGDKDPAAVALGRKGGLKGGRARAAALTAERRSEIARQAALARWERLEEP